MKIQATTNHLRMLASVKGEVWAMNDHRVQEFALACLDAAEKADSDNMSAFFPMKAESVMVSVGDQKIAVIPVKGSLLNKVPRIYEELGLATRYQTVIDETKAAVNAGASGIVYDFDSPGGTVAGVVEAGAAIANAGVPTIGYASGLSCSASYWLMSQTNAIVAAPSAEIGNIGAILSWADCSGFWNELGVEFKALTSEGADLKSTFHLEPNDSQLEFLQERINEAGKAFREAVTEGRAKAGVELDAEVWRAGWYSGEKAGSLGLLDDIGSIETALSYFRK